MTPDWLNVQKAAQDSSPSEIDGRSFGRSLASLRWVAFSAQISSDVLFHMQTRAADPQDAALLADELRAYLIRARVSAAGPPEFRQVVDQAAIGQTGDRVDLFMPVTGPAMQRIKNDEMFRSLFRWRWGVEEREARENVREIFDLLGVDKGRVVADVGAGGGFYTVRLARAVGSAGRVLAVDIDAQAVAGLRERIREASYSQVEVVLGDTDNPKLPPQMLDAVLIVNSYHEICLLYTSDAADE